MSRIDAYRPGAAWLLLPVIWMLHSAVAGAQTNPEPSGDESIETDTPSPPDPAVTETAAEAPSAEPTARDQGRVRPGLDLLGNIQLHGHFDVAYERRGYSGYPFDGDQARLANYHRFVFLTRDAQDDPFSFNVELVDLSFFEVAYRHRFETLKIDTRLRAGKILVPFGAEPLYHHSYGGLSGFDQRVLPIIWSKLGVAVQARRRWRGIHFSGDLYFVQGYALRDADEFINLQSDFSPDDDVRIGSGLRLGASWGPISAWYSGYLNRLGFDRLLLLQAIDVGVWKVPGIPVLEDLTLSVGAIRSDVSGGGSGNDYYSFANYAQLRYYPTDWLYVQYRTGVRYMNNRRGFFKDETRLDSDDESTHNVAIVARYRSVMVSLTHFWNFEEYDERDDDFLRLMVAYVF